MDSTLGYFRSSLRECHKEPEEISVSGGSRATMTRNYDGASNADEGYGHCAYLHIRLDSGLNLRYT
jgi:hypothetical protein